MAACGSSVAAFSYSKLNNKRCAITSSIAMSSRSFGYRNNNRSGGYRNRNYDWDDDDRYDDEFRSNGIYRKSALVLFYVMTQWTHILALLIAPVYLMY